MSNLQIDGRKTLREFLEEGIIHPGCQFRIKKQHETMYQSKKARNGAKDQTFTSFDLEDFLTFEVIRQENNSLFVLGEIYIKEFILGGAEGYIYGPNELNNICHELFSSKHLKARSINLEDVNKILRIKLKNNSFILNEGTEKETKLCDLQKITVQKNTYTPESFLQNRYEKEGSTLFLENEFFQKRNLETSEFQKRLIFKKHPYYLATKGSYKYIDSVIAYGLYVVTGISEEASCEPNNLFYSEGSRWYSLNKGIRPVGYIDIDVPIEETGIVDVIIPRIYLKIS